MTAEGPEGKPVAPINGGTAKEVVKSLGRDPALLALVVLVGVLIYAFGERISNRIDLLSTRIDACCTCQEPR